VAPGETLRGQKIGKKAPSFGRSKKVLEKRDRRRSSERARHRHAIFPTLVGDGTVSYCLKDLPSGYLGGFRTQHLRPVSGSPLRRVRSDSGDSPEIEQKKWQGRPWDNRARTTKQRKKGR